MRVVGCGGDGGGGGDGDEDVADAILVGNGTFDECLLLSAFFAILFLDVGARGGDATRDGQTNG
jgi:hypothetical protein